MRVETPTLKNHTVWLFNGVHYLRSNNTHQAVGKHAELRKLVALGESIEYDQAQAAL